MVDLARGMLESFLLDLSSGGSHVHALSYKEAIRKEDLDVSIS